MGIWRWSRNRDGVEFHESLHYALISGRRRAVVGPRSRRPCKPTRLTDGNGGWDWPFRSNLRLYDWVLKASTEQERLASIFRRRIFGPGIYGFDHFRRSTTLDSVATKNNVQKGKGDPVRAARLHSNLTSVGSNQPSACFFSDARVH